VEVPVDECRHCDARYSARGDGQKALGIDDGRVGQRGQGKEYRVSAHGDLRHERGNGAALFDEQVDADRESEEGMRKTAGGTDAATCASVKEWISRGSLVSYDFAAAT
jgi:hypothetical protein